MSLITQERTMKFVHVQNALYTKGVSILHIQEANPSRNPYISSDEGCLEGEARNHCNYNMLYTGARGTSTPAKVA